MAAFPVSPAGPATLHHLGRKRGERCLCEDSGADFLLLHFTLSAGAELAEPCGVGGGSEDLDL